MSELLSLRRLAFATPVEPAKDIGTAGELRWLRLAHLYVDPAYQRSILDAGKANIRRMIEEFSWAKFGTLVVSRRGKDRYAIIDGQHRATAAFIRGDIDTVPCLIMTFDRAAEARAFSVINHNITRIHPLQSFRAAVTGGDEEAVRLTKVCAGAAVTVAPYPKTDLDPGETCALTALRTCLKRHGETVLTTALMILRAADPEHGLPGTAVQALCTLTPDRLEWHRDAAHIGELLGRGGDTLARIVERAAARRLTHGGPLYLNFAKLAENKIAFGLRNPGANINRLMAGR